MKTYIFRPSGFPFPIYKNTLGQFDPVYCSTLYHFKYTYPISLENFKKYFKYFRTNWSSLKVSLKLFT